MQQQHLEQVGEYLTIEAAARQRGTTRWALYAYIRRNNVPTRRIGNTLLVRLVDLVGFIPR